MADLKIELTVKVSYTETLTYSGDDVLMAEALIELVKLNKVTPGKD